MEGHLHSHHVHRHTHGSHGHQLSARISSREASASAELIPEIMAAPSIELERRSGPLLVPRADCNGADKDKSICEKPAAANSLTVAITLAVVIPIVVALGVLIYLHQRTTKRQKMEDNDDKYRSMDFGLGETKGSKRKSVFGLGGEKDNRPHNRQISMDMNLSSPYLLPPNLQNSRESLNSLSRTLHQSDDPYRHVETFTGSDAGSLRSFRKGTNDTSSTYTGKTITSNDRSSRTHTLTLPNRQSSVPPSPLSRETPNILDQPRFAEPEPISPPPPSAKGDFRFVDDESAVPQMPVPAPVASQAQAQERVDMPPMPEIQEPAPVAQKSPAKSFAGRPRPDSEAFSPTAERPRVPPAGLGIMEPSQAQPAEAASQPPARGESGRVVSDVPSEYEDYANHFQVEDEQDQYQHQRQHGHDGRGRQGPRGYEHEHEYEHEHPNSAGLGVPQQNNKRLSVGMRPLPPDDYLQSEDPEFRANRIRSFYKEYFDDSKEQRPPMPQPPAQYYEDYDSNYMGDAAFFDPDSNTFVMPYAQPVTRRAMTPPPSNRRPMPGPRPRGPPGHPGSMGGMPGGPHGRPRAGSTMSAAGRWGNASPRPDSSASGRMGRPGAPKKPIPPPADLSTLPTPSKLRDDSFAIMGAADFAPPPTFKDIARGRSQSPSGERRPYQVNVPVASPLASSFDDIPALPSPHSLRKSSTFTALDFAPPRRFKDPDSMSDAGSVRSMGSNISARNQQAIRAGAGRVSRLPGDQVFTQAAMGTELKPKWGMRD